MIASSAGLMFPERLTQGLQSGQSHGVFRGGPLSSPLTSQSSPKTPSQGLGFQSRVDLNYINLGGTRVQFLATINEANNCVSESKQTKNHDKTNKPLAQMTVKK